MAWDEELEHVLILEVLVNFSCFLCCSRLDGVLEVLLELWVIEIGVVSVVEDLVALQGVSKISELWHVAIGVVE